MKQWIHLGLFLFIAVFYSSCATTHPNEKLLTGEWKPVKVEKYFTAEEEEMLKKAQSQSTGVRTAPPAEKPPAATGGSVQTDPSTPPAAERGRGGEQAGGRNPEEELNKLIRTESRSNMKIFPDKTIEKYYQVKTLHGTWKMNGSGNVLVVKVPEKHERYRIDILEIGETRMVVVGNLPVGGIKIEYEKIGDAIKEETK